MNIENDEQHYKFCLLILKAFHLEPTLFFSRIADNEYYECLIYSWVNQLYEEERSIAYSIEQIHKARHQLFFSGKHIIALPKKKNDSNTCCILEETLHYTIKNIEQTSIDSKAS
ncbi:hypothetical protein [Aquimarina sp. RZ0]|uniref:hypothetical protein n=1 Tax=Aquimarina sp. RZ0 TaxID=2607730 RepID=UPI0011F0A310|nr:hypothetical protein [Aquimarina sp. RZ0]KAA1244501.1 hypothetical protein F0000_16065 [Aquimarina sp. RZ0]